MEVDGAISAIFSARKKLCKSNGGGWGDGLGPRGPEQQWCSVRIRGTENDRGA
jgi:hypothetical protein